MTQISKDQNSVGKYANSYAAFLSEADILSYLLPIDSLFVIREDMFNDRLYKKNRGLQINDESYIMKCSYWDALDSYTEHISSSFIRECGYSAQHTFMGIYNASIAVLCKDFTNEYGLLKPFEFNSEYWIYEYYLSELIEYFEMKKNCDVDDCVKKFWEMCLFDILLDNRDRHSGNVGFCIKNEEHVFSPLYDNAQTLDHDIFKNKYFNNFKTANPELIISECGLTRSWYEYKHKNEQPRDIISKFQELDVVSAMDRSTAGFKDEWRSYFRTIIYYRHKCLIRGDKFVWEGMK